jgi:hypothetical protein
MLVQFLLKNTKIQQLKKIFLAAINFSLFLSWEKLLEQLKKFAKSLEDSGSGISQPDPRLNHPRSAIPWHRRFCLLLNTPLGCILDLTNTRLKFLPIGSTGYL